MSQPIPSKPAPPSLPVDAGGDSIDASLEDFITQANKSFQEPSDWTLNTDEVELITEDDLAPVQPAKIAAAVKGAQIVTTKGDAKKADAKKTDPQMVAKSDDQASAKKGAKPEEGKPSEKASVKPVAKAAGEAQAGASAGASEDEDTDDGAGDADAALDDEPTKADVAPITRSNGEISAKEARRAAQKAESAKDAKKDGGRETKDSKGKEAKEAGKESTKDKSAAK